MEELGYLTIDESVRRQWQFTLNWPETIEAVSTDEMNGGAGKSITYDILQGNFMGYGLPNEGEGSDF